MYLSMYILVGTHTWQTVFHISKSLLLKWLQTFAWLCWLCHHGTLVALSICHRINHSNALWCHLVLPCQCEHALLSPMLWCGLWRKLAAMGDYPHGSSLAVYPQADMPLKYLYQPNFKGTFFSGQLTLEPNIYQTEHETLKSKDPNFTAAPKY